MKKSAVLSLIILNIISFTWADGFTKHSVFVPDPANPWPWQEGKAIEKAKQKSPMQGATIYCYFKNNSDKPLTLKEVLVNGKKVSKQAVTPPYRVVWWRLNPQTLQPDQVGELAVRMRFVAGKSFTIKAFFESGHQETFRIIPKESKFRIQTIAFTPNLTTAYLYVERNNGDLQHQDVLLDGKKVPGKVKWLSKKCVGLVRVAKVQLDKPLAKGAWHTWSVKAGAFINSATLRTFGNTFSFGIYGDQSYDRYAKGGLSGVYMFAKQNKQSLDQAKAAGLEVVMHITKGNAPKATRNHPALFGYNIYDEPDAKDWAAGKDRPEYWRIGTLGPKMVREIQTCQQQDPSKPAMLTVDLTFTPTNYYTYGPIADITTPDLYPMAVGWPLKSILVGARHAKRATAPRPFGFTFQGCFERYSKLPKGKSWIGRDEVLRIGFDKLSDPKRSRGYNRKPHPSEIKMQVAYILGAGAKNFWAWWDITECSWLLFQGLRDLPAQWQAVCEMSKTLLHARNQIELSHPAELAKSSTKGVWVATLLCGEKDVLVVAVNENNRTKPKGFAAKPIKTASVTLPNIEWLKVNKIELLGPDKLTKIDFEQDKSGVTWKLGELRDVAVFRLSR